MRGLIVSIVIICLIASTSFLLQVSATNDINIDNDVGAVPNNPITYYVDGNNISGECSDINLGSKHEPFCTIQKGVDSATYGDTVYVREGTYQASGPNLVSAGAVVYLQGLDFSVNPTKYFRLAAYPGENTVINANNTYAAIQGYGGRISIEGFKITNIGVYGIRFLNHLEGTPKIIGNSIIGCSNPDICIGISIEGEQDCLIENNNISNPFQYSDIEVNLEGYWINNENFAGIIVSANSCEIIGNIVNSTGALGILVSGNNNLISGNSVFDSNTCIKANSCSECKILGNTVYSSSGVGGFGMIINNSEDSLIANNTIASFPGVCIEFEGNSDKISIFSNIVHGCGEEALIILNHEQSDIESDYNLFHSNSATIATISGSDEDVIQESIDSGNFPEVIGKNGRNLLSVDPFFNSPNNFDFRPEWNSPVCNMSLYGGHIGSKGCMTSPGPVHNPGYCIPAWSCSEWSPCVNNNQTMNCVDLNSCGNDSSKPEEKRECGINGNNDNPLDGVDNIPVTVPPNNVGTGDNLITRIRPHVIANQTVRNNNIFSGSLSTFQITNDEIGIDEIKVWVNRNITSAEIIIDRLSHRPDDIIEEVPGTPYQYLNITHGEIKEDDIDNLTILFSVNKSWLFQNMMNSSDVYLARLAGSWTILPTRIIGESNAEVNYEADSPGLSMFSIFGGSVLFQTNRTCVPFDIQCSGNTLQECDRAGSSWNTKINCEFGCNDMGCMEESDGPPPASPFTGIIVIGGLIVILSIVAFVFELKRNQATKSIHRWEP